MKEANRHRDKRGRKHLLPPALSLLLAAFVLLSLAPCLYGQQRQQKEYDVKAAFIFNFIKFVQWPEEDDIPGWRFCVVGTDRFGAAIDDLSRKTVKEKKITVKREESVAALKHCHVLFIGSSEWQRLKSILTGVREYRVLTVGDTEDFAHRGVMINFYLEEGKVRFEINMDAVRRANLKIDSKLLRLARIIQGQ